MKYKVGDKIIFNQDCRLAFSYIPKGKTGEITDIVDTGLTIAYRIKMKDYPNATVPTDKVDEACTKIKPKNDKHNILNGLLQTDGSVDLERLVSKLENNSAVGNDYYAKSAMQPLEVSQVLLTREQFAGALLFNIIKYRMRKKGQDDSDAYKARQYAFWLELVQQGKTINPSVDIVPDDYEFKVV